MKLMVKKEQNINKENYRMKLIVDSGTSQWSEKKYIIFEKMKFTSFIS